MRNRIIMGVYNTIRTIIDDPIYSIIVLLSFIYRISLVWRKNVMVGRNLRLKGWPIIETIAGGRVTLGANVTLYSTRRHYFAALSSPVRLFAEKNGHIVIGDNTRINGATIHARSDVTIGKNCLIAANTSIIDSHGHELCLNNPEQRIHSIDAPLPIIIGDNVWIGMNCLILKGVEIGSGAVIGAHSVISRSVQANSVFYSPKS